MAQVNKQDYSIFSALVETINNQYLKKLRFAKCQECGRLTPFRLTSRDIVTIECKKCRNKVPIKI
ncbi:hypothetical protein KJN74_01630 [Candidatus Bathyarchaeota archaeon]|nr:hypothetical protein [Candidatus Bathyarchaeota archaeon]